jgi:hypothetical protein
MKLISAVVCDDIRTELNGKDILIGCYNDTIVIPSVPSVLPSLFFRLLFKSEFSGTSKFNLTLFDPEGKTVFGTLGEMFVVRENEPIAVKIGIGPIVLEHFGTYTLNEMPIDAKPEDKGIPLFEFAVRAPYSDLENTKP